MTSQVLANSHGNKCVFKTNGFIFKAWECKRNGYMLNYFLYLPKKIFAKSDGSLVIDDF